jgi:hypothetical protein
MTTIVEAEQMIGRASSFYASKFQIDFVEDWKLAAACWSGEGQETAFQHPL